LLTLQPVDLLTLAVQLCLVSADLLVLALVVDLLTLELVTNEGTCP
jgi:hypothetical protein